MTIKKKKRRNKKGYYHLFLFENNTDLNFWINYYESITTFLPEESNEKIELESLITKIIHRISEKYKTTKYIYSSILHEEEMDKFINICMLGTSLRFQYEIREKIRLQKEVDDLKQTLNNFVKFSK